MVLRGPLRGRVGRRRTQSGTRVVRFAEWPSFSLLPSFPVDLEAQMPRDPSRNDRTPSKPSRAESARSAGRDPSRSARGESARSAGRDSSRSARSESSRSARSESSRSARGESARSAGRDPSRSARGESSRSSRGESARSAGRDPSRSSRGGTSGAEPSRRDRADRKGSGRNVPSAGSRDKAGGSARRTDPTKQSARARESRSAAQPEPAIPDAANIHLLDRDVRADLRSLSKPNAEIVGAHLAAAGLFLDDDPRRALDHARAARARAARIGAVREAVGIAAYRAQQWAEALSELRAARRITGDPRNLAVMADTERALGRPAQAVRMLDDPDVARLDAETRAELLIVVAGARRDLGQIDAALGVLARGGLDTRHPRPGSVRLWYAYADALQ